MKAVIQEKYGSPEVLEIREMAKPAVAPGNVLVRVRAAAVNPYDWHVLRGSPFLVRIAFGLLRPKQKTPGRDWAGTVEAVGEAVTLYQPGDEVFGISAGAFAEYLCVSEDRPAPKPANITHEEAAAVPMAALTALQGLRDKGRIQPGHRVLINGASGGIGTFAVQIAKSFGANVTGVCSTKNVELVASLGADRVIDYRHEDFTRNGARYDLALDTVGNRSLSDCQRILAPNGVYVTAAYSLRRMVWQAVRRPKNVAGIYTQIRREDLVVMKELMEAGKVRPVIDRRYPLSEIAEAIRYVEEGHARGKVIITI
ncbi:MAG: NAD(P)-dependent alcohol dehydrogenase [Chloroflexi bacterium]|nr:NAD(P)-dependent alcohol dehydrogenase [Chloroflexota bacterium]